VCYNNSIALYTREARGIPGRYREGTGNRPDKNRRGSGHLPARIRTVAGTDPVTGSRAIGSRCGGSKVAPARFQGSFESRRPASGLPWRRTSGLCHGRAPVAPARGLPSRWHSLRDRVRPPAFPGGGRPAVRYGVPGARRGPRKTPRAFSASIGVFAAPGERLGLVSEPRAA